MDEIIYKGYTIKIEQDEFAESPRMDENDTEMICFHKRYDLGDKHEYNHEDYGSWDELETAIRKSPGDLILPLYLYDHSILRMKIGSFAGLLPQGHAEFDSGMVGFIVYRAEKIRSAFMVKRITKEIKEKALRIMQGDVERYDAYISGQVYSFRIEKDGEAVDSCGGFYDYDDAEKEAKDQIDYLVDEANKKHQEQVKAYIKHNVPLNKRGGE